VPSLQKALDRVPGQQHTSSNTEIQQKEPKECTKNTYPIAKTDDFQAKTRIRTRENRDLRAKFTES
jgi:hypothetical protein